MIAGAPEEARWVRAAPRHTLTAPLLEWIARRALAGCCVVNAQPLEGGLRNTNFRLDLDSPGQAVVLRIYEHDPSLCQKEVDLIRLAGIWVPVADVIHAEPLGAAGFPPFAVMRYVEGWTFRELKRCGGREALVQAAYSAGQSLAAVGRFKFANCGWLGPGPRVTAPLLEGADPLPRFVDLCLATPNLRERVPAELCDRTHALVWTWAPRLEELDRDARLVHGDFGKRNLLVRNVAGKWQVAAVVDWEFAVAGSPLADIGHFLRYERAARPSVEPHFSTGYQDGGGTLPEDWRRLARLADLVALCENLTHEDLPEPAVGELVELVRATVEGRDPRLG